MEQLLSELDLTTVCFMEARSGVCSFNTASFELSELCGIAKYLSPLRVYFKEVVTGIFKAL